MNLFTAFQNDIDAIIKDLIKAGALPEGLEVSRITVEPPRDASNGDISTNAAMVLAKPAGMKPRDIAELIAPRLGALPGVTKVDIAGPGFINAGLSNDFWHARLADILKSGTDYGSSEMGKGIKINVEYVSANPTGPLHVAHARGAVVGDALGNLDKPGIALRVHRGLRRGGAGEAVAAGYTGSLQAKVKGYKQLTVSRHFRQRGRRRQQAHACPASGDNIHDCRPSSAMARS